MTVNYKFSLDPFDMQRATIAITQRMGRNKEIIIFGLVRGLFALSNDDVMCQLSVVRGLAQHDTQIMMLCVYEFNMT